MTLRVLLVGAVASLGLAVPSGEKLESWSRSGRAWLNARVVEWGTNRPVDEGALVFLADATEVTPAVPEPVKAPSAGPVDKAPAEAVKAVAQAPAAIEEFDEQDAFEEWTVTLMQLPLLEVPAEAPAVVAELSEVPPSWLIELLANGSSQTVVDEREFLVTAEAIEFAPKPACESPADPDRAFQNVVEEMAHAFAADNAQVHAAEVLVANEVTSIEPLELGDDLYPGVAYALNHDAEGLDATVSDDPLSFAKPASPAPVQAERWTNALRKTREAVNAWANLLHGPALVTIDR